MEKKLLTTKEAAKYLGMSVSFLASSRMNGNLEGHLHAPCFIKVGKRGIRYSEEDLISWIDKNRCELKGGINS